VVSFAFALLYQRFALRRDTAGALTGAGRSRIVGGLSGLAGSIKG